MITPDKLTTSHIQQAFRSALCSRMDMDNATNGMLTGHRLQSEARQRICDAINAATKL